MRVIAAHAFGLMVASPTTGCLRLGMVESKARTALVVGKAGYADSSAGGLSGGFPHAAFDQPSQVAATILSHQVPRIYARKPRPPWSSVSHPTFAHRLAPIKTTARARMPKDTLPPSPLSGLFAVAKPSGPTSMAVINDVKNLINTSSLFVEREKLAPHPENSEKPRRRKRKSNRDMVKIGQGGTLDPLAGESSESPLRFLFSQSDYG